MTVENFDLGHLAAGTLELTISRPIAGTVIDVAAAEHLDDTGLRYICTDDKPEEHIDSLGDIGARHLHVSVRPPPGHPSPEVALAIHHRHRPRPAGASFACSDPVIETIYQVGLRTVDLCAPDAYIDCPTREQRAWTGDSVVHQMVDLVANPDGSMARRHSQLAATPRPDGMLPMAAASDFTADDRTVRARASGNFDRFCPTGRHDRSRNPQRPVGLALFRLGRDRKRAFTVHV